MKNLKKISILTLFIVVLLLCSLQATFAANQTIDSNNITGIKGAIDVASAGDTVFLQPGTYSKNGNDTNFTITKNITIQGNGSRSNIIIDAQGAPRIAIGNNLNVTFINITFKNFNSADRGGAIYTLSPTTFINCIFENNRATEGGAIYMTNGADLIIGSLIINSTFINNIATNNGTSGGAISNYRNNFTVISSIFINNIAIHINTNNISIGGAICNHGDDFTVIDSIFINNTAGTSGGAINIQESKNSAIFNSNFTGNIAGTGNFNLNLIGGTTGGAITNWANNATIVGCNFINNTAAGNGGAVANRGVVVFGIYINPDILPSITIANSNFINNTARNGGSIFNELNGDALLSNNTMSGNSANDRGHMIYNTGTMGVLNLTFMGNSTLTTSKGSTVLLYATLTDDMGNTITGQDISFYVNGVFIANVSSVEGKASTAYLITADSEAILPVTGDYGGHEGYPILLKNGALLIPETSTYIHSETEEKQGSKTKTKLSVTAKGNKITATLIDEFGNPLANKKIVFKVKGFVIGVATTDANGVANIFYKSAEGYTITATFEGDENNTSSTATYYSTTENSKEENLNTTASGKIGMKKTGTPVMLVLLALFTIVSLLTHKKENKN